jgi:hypothetical protein
VYGTIKYLLEPFLVAGINAILQTLFFIFYLLFILVCGELEFGGGPLL